MAFNFHILSTLRRQNQIKFILRETKRILPHFGVKKYFSTWKPEFIYISGPNIVEQKNYSPQSEGEFLFTLYGLERSFCRLVIRKWMLHEFYRHGLLSITYIFGYNEKVFAFVLTNYKNLSPKAYWTLYSGRNALRKRTVPFPLQMIGKKSSKWILKFCFNSFVS